MPRSFNAITLVGHAGRDPNTRSLTDGTAVCDFSIATNDRRKGEEDQATWFRVNVFGRQAEFASEYIKKGSFVYVSGTLSQQEFQGRDGGTKTSLEVRAREIQLLDRREDNGAGDGRRPASKAEVAAAGAAFSDDVPF